MGCFLCHTNPNLVLLRSPCITEKQISYKEEYSDHAELNNRIIFKLSKQKRILIKDITDAGFSKIDSYRCVLSSHAMNGCRHICCILHLFILYVPVIHDMCLGAVGDNDRHRSRIQYYFRKE